MSDPVIVLLAAGASSRMRGADKLLETVDDQPLIRLMADRCRKAGTTRVVVGPAQAERRAALAGVAVEIVESTGSDGMAASIRAGIKGMKKKDIMVVLADMPEITAADMHLLLSLHAQGLAPIVQAATEDGTPGQPVVFSAKYLRHLGNLQGDEGARSILRSHASDVARVPLTGRRALVDLDTPEDWSAWRKGK